MGTTFAEKFEAVLQRRIVEAEERGERYGVRTIARQLAKDDPKQTEIIRRRLNKYRPKNGGGAAEVAPTPPTRWEIEDAMGLERDTLKPERDPEADAVAASAMRFGVELAELFDARMRELEQERHAVVAA